VLVLVVYGALALLAYWPVWPGDPYRLAATGGYDITQNVWFIQWVPFALTHGYNPFFSSWVNYPDGVNVINNASMPLLGFVTSPLTLAVNAISSMNLLMWLAFPLSAFAMYVVLRRLRASDLGAFFGGLLYGFSPYMVAQGGSHLNLEFVPLPPLIFLCAYELVIKECEKPIRWGLLLGLCCAGQLLIAPEILATSATMLIIGLLLLAARYPRLAVARLRTAARGLAVFVVLFVAVGAYPLWFTFAGPQHFIGRPWGYNNGFHSDLLSAIVPTDNQAVGPQHLKAIGTSYVYNDVTENGGYLGIPLILLASWWVVRFRRDLRFVWLGIMTVVVYACSLGVQLVVNGHVTSVWLPFNVLDSLPIVDGALAVRLCLYVMMFVAVIVALGLDATVATWRSAAEGKHRGGERLRRRAAVASCVLLGAAVVSLCPSWPYPLLRTDLPHFFESASVREIPIGSVALVYPYPSDLAAEGMLWQAASDMRFKLLGGYVMTPGPGDAVNHDVTVLYPDTVQELFAYQFSGLRAPRISIRALLQLGAPTLRSFVMRNKVAVVMVDLSALHSAPIVELVSDAFGPPQFDGGGVMIWLRP